MRLGHGTARSEPVLCPVVLEERLCGAPCRSPACPALRSYGRIRCVCIRTPWLGPHRVHSPTAFCLDSRYICVISVTTRLLTPGLPASESPRDGQPPCDCISQLSPPKLPVVSLPGLGPAHGLDVASGTSCPLLWGRQGHPSPLGTDLSQSSPDGLDRPSCLWQVMFSKIGLNAASHPTRSSGALPPTRGEVASVSPFLEAGRGSETVSTGTAWGVLPCASEAGSHRRDGDPCLPPGNPAATCEGRGLTKRHVGVPHVMGPKQEPSG